MIGALLRSFTFPTPALPFRNDPNASGNASVPPPSGADFPPSSGDHVKLRFFDWIWQIKGSLPLAPDQSREEAFDRLAPLFRQTGTSHERDEDALSFRKSNPAAQDKMSIFDGGILKVEEGASESTLHYRLTSRALLFCFLAPLLFLAFAQLTVAVGKYQSPSAEDPRSKEAKKDDVQLRLNPVDKFLGAPVPEKPKKDKAEKEEDDDKPSPTPAYVFAAIFAALYIVGRILEARLVRRLFKSKLNGV